MKSTCRRVSGSDHVFPVEQIRLLHVDPIRQLAILVGMDVGGIRLDHRLDRSGLGEHADGQRAVALLTPTYWMLTSAEPFAPHFFWSGQGRFSMAAD